jgi:hypothetical protein
MPTSGLRTTSKGAYSRMELNQSRLDDVTLAVADGLFEAGRTIVELASERAPDSPYDPFPAGEGLPKQGGVLVYVANKKTHGWSIRGDQPVKPRAARLTTKLHSVVAIIGFGFPGRFNEAGTIRQPARPFLTPSANEVAPHIPEIVGSVTRPKLAGMR